jgi:hypothetical protein
MDNINNEDFVDISVNEFGQVLPPKNDKIALIDADTLIYTAALATESRVELMPKESYTDDEWSAIMDNPTYDEGDNSIYESDLGMLLWHARTKLDKILDMTGCQDYELHFTYGKESFRYKLYPEYKMNRKYIRRPMYLVEAKDWFVNNDKGVKHTYIEADDAVVWLKRNYPEKYILCCVDKDVYNAVEGHHFNYYESGKFNKNMHWVDTLKEDAEMWPYMQAIIGDKSDNIIGLHGIGPAKVKKLITKGGDYREQLIKAFEDNGKTVQDALLNLALVTCGENKIMKGYFDERS